MTAIEQDIKQTPETPADKGKDNLDFAAKLPPEVRAHVQATPQVEVPADAADPSVFPTETEVIMDTREGEEAITPVKEGGDDPTIRPADSVFNNQAWKERAVEPEDDVTVQERTSADGSILWKLSQEARKAEVDPESACGESQQPDGGIGAKAFAAAHATRVQKSAEAGETEAVAVCEVDSRHGVGMRDFLEGVKEFDEEHGTDVYTRTKPVIVCTEDRQRAIEESGILKEHNVEFRRLEENDVKLPDNTGAVLLDGTLNRQPTHKLHYTDKALPGRPFIREETFGVKLAGNKTPLIPIDPVTCQAKVVPPSRFYGKGPIPVTENPESLHQLMPQLAGRIGPTDTGYRDEAKYAYQEGMKTVHKQVEDGLNSMPTIEETEAAARAYAQGATPNKEAQDRIVQEQVNKIVEARAAVKAAGKEELDKLYAEYLKQGAYRSLGEKLARREDNVRSFLDKGEVPPEYLVNYSPEGTQLLRTLIDQARPGALILISGPKRDDLEGDENRLPPSKLSPTAGSLITNVVEGAMVRSVVKEAGDYTVFSQVTKPGEHGHIVIDLDPTGKDTWSEQQVFTDVLQRPRESAEQFMTNAVRKARQYEDKLDTLPEGIRKINKDYVNAVEENQHVAGDYTLARELAQLFNGCGKYDEQQHKEAPEYARSAAEAALGHAQRASRLVPSASAPHFEMARSLYTLGRYDEAAGALERAHQLSPRNADIYNLGMRVAMKQNDISAYVDNASRYLQYNPNMSVKQTVDGLMNLCEALSADHQLNANNTQPYKTILVENTQTGERTLKTLSVAHIKQIKAADAWLAAHEAVQELLNYQPYATGTNQERDDIAQAFLNGYEMVRPCRAVQDERTGQITFEDIPRDSWPDRPPIDSNERYVFEGSIVESDTERPPQVLYEMLKDGKQETAKQEEVTEEPEAYQLPSRDELVLGAEIDAAGQEKGSKVAVTSEILARHVFISGQSGAGKTELVKGLVGQFHGMGLGYTVIAASNKPGEYNDLIARFEGQDVRIIRVGVDAISLNMLDPDAAIGNTEQEKVQKTISDFRKDMETAYNMPPPLNTMFSKVLYRVFAANGWDTGNPDYPVANLAPTVPTIEQIEAAWDKEVSESYEKGGKRGEQSNLMHGFLPNRLSPLKSSGSSDESLGEGLSIGSLARALIDGPMADMEAIVTGRVVLEFSSIANAEQRRLAALAWTRRINDYMVTQAQKEGYNRGVRHVIVIDEAQNIVPAESAGGDEARSGAVSEFAAYVLEARGFGISYMVATQQEQAVHQAFPRNAGLRIAGMQTGAENKRTVALSLASTDESAARTQERLHKLEIGEALVSGVGIKEPVGIRVSYDPSRIPSADEVKRAVRDQPPLPIVTSEIDRGAVAEAAASARQTPLRISVEAEIIAALTGTEQSPHVLPEARAWWQRTVAQNPAFAHQVVRAVVGRAVDKRAKAITDARKAAEMGPAAAKFRQANAMADSVAKDKLTEEGVATERKINEAMARKPQELAQEVYATVLGKLKGEPTGHGRYANARHVLPQIAVLKHTVDIVAPYFRQVPREDNFAKPLQHAVPGVQPAPRQRVAARREALTNHTLSIVKEASEGTPDETARSLIYRALVGDDEGVGFFNDIDTYTGTSEPHIARRAEVAAWLGAKALHSPEHTSFEEALGYTAHLNKTRVEHDATQ